MTKVRFWTVLFVSAIALSGATTAGATGYQPYMDVVATKCNVHKLWGVPWHENYDGWIVVGHAYDHASGEKRANNFVPFGHYKRHCKSYPFSRYPMEGLQHPTHSTADITY